MIIKHITGPRQRKTAPTSVINTALSIFSAFSQGEKQLIFMETSCFCQGLSTFSSLLFLLLYNDFIFFLFS